MADTGPSGFSDKLDLVLKALSISRGRLAADLGVDKSLVSRWLSGAVRPSGHNLSRLSELIGERRPGFSMLDWERDLGAIASVIGVGNARPPEAAAQSAAPPTRDPSAGALPLLPFDVAALARRETERRGSAYDGHYRCIRPSATRAGMMLREHVMIRRGEDGLTIRQVGGGWECRGWLLSLQSQLYGVLADSGDDSILFMLLNGVTQPKALTLDGLALTVALERAQTPVAMPIVLQRIGDLADDPDEDDRRVDAAKAGACLIESREIDPEVRDHLLPDFGPAAFAGGGELLLRIRWDRSLAKGGNALSAVED